MKGFNNSCTFSLYTRGVYGKIQLNQNCTLGIISLAYMSNRRKKNSIFKMKTKKYSDDATAAASNATTNTTTTPLPQQEQ